jgi:hypothetical protein
MRYNSRAFGMVVAIAISGLMAGVVQAQTTTDVKRVEIVSVDGNRLVVRSEQGTEQITVTDDFRLTVDGRPIAVGDLKPGMRGTARTTTTTTVTPGEQTTEVRRGEIVKRSGASVAAEYPEGTTTYTDEDLAARKVPVTVNGRPVMMSSLWEGTKLTETTVTTAPERVLTQRQIDFALQAPQVAAATPRPAPVQAPADPPASLVLADPVPPPARELPKTASPLPGIGLVGIVCSAADCGSPYGVDATKNRSVAHKRSRGFLGSSGALTSRDV